MKTLIKNFLIVFGVLLVITALLSTANFNTKKPEVVGINALIQDINDESVKSIEVKGDYLYATLKDENASQLEVKKEMGQSFSELMSNYGVAPERLAKVDVSVKDETGWKCRSSTRSIFSYFKRLTFEQLQLKLQLVNLNKRFC